MSQTPGRVTEPALTKDDVKFDTKLRPTDFSEFVGQEKLKDNLSIFIQAARKREEPLDHCLFYGPSSSPRPARSSRGRTTSRGY